MSLTITPVMRALLIQQTHRLAKVYELRRTDGEILRFTDHNRMLTIDGFDYTPTGSGSLSATRRVSELEDAGADFMGVLTSDAITYNDLHAGRYREAKITTRMVDWRYPFEGSFSKSVHWIMEVKHDGEQWTASLSSIAGWLRYNVGDVHGRTCELTLYEPRCGVSKGGYALTTDTCAVTSIITPRLKFGFTGNNNSQTDDYFNGGDLIWYGGLNRDLVSQIKVYVVSTSPDTIELELETPLDIQVGDTFNGWRGCNKLGRTGDCKLIFNNMVNFLGYQDMPGTDRMVASPTR